MTRRVVGVVVHEGDEKAAEVAKRVLEVLEEYVDEVVVYPNISYTSKKVRTLKVRGEICGEFLIAVGGDGTALRTFLAVGERDIPVMVVGTGRRNFLSSVGADLAEWGVRKVLSGDFFIKELKRIKTSSASSDYPPSLNEVYITSKRPGKSIWIDLFLSREGEGKSLFSEKMDGLIVATPTGSSAYSLAAGGSVISNELEAMSITPVCPHRKVPPLVIPMDYEVEVKADPRDAVVVIDGNFSFEMPENGSIKITKAKSPARLIAFKETWKDFMLKAVEAK